MPVVAVRRVGGGVGSFLVFAPAAGAVVVRRRGLPPLMIVSQSTTGYVNSHVNVLSVNNKNKTTT